MLEKAEAKGWCVPKKKDNGKKESKKKKGGKAAEKKSTEEADENDGLSLEGNRNIVVNFVKAARIARDRFQNGADFSAQVDYFADWATSLGNLLLRAISDVHALFSVYFADDPNWDGDCSSLKPRFQLMFEDHKQGLKEHTYKPKNKGIRDASAKLDWLRDVNDGQEWHTIKYRSDGVLGKQGPKEKDANNPWCQRSWISASLHTPEVLRFAVADPATGGKDGFQSPPAEDVDSMMHPLLWCKLVEHWRTLPANERNTVRRCGQNAQLQDSCVNNGIPVVDSEPELVWSAGSEKRVKNGRAGQKLRFNAACQQLRRAKRNDGSEHLEIEYLEECEQAVMSVPFQTIFPDFMKEIHAAFHQAGSQLEDGLQCAGRLGSGARQFTSERHHEFHRCQALHERARIVRESAEGMLHVVRAFLVQLGAVDARQGQRATWESTPEGAMRQSQHMSVSSEMTHSQGQQCCTLAAGPCSMVMPLACSSSLVPLAKLNPRGRLDRNFYDAFAFVNIYGSAVTSDDLPPILTGKMYAALWLTDAELSADATIEERITTAKNQLALKFRMQSIASGDDSVAKMYPQFKYSEQISVKFNINLGQRFDFCSVKKESGGGVGVVARWSGDSWSEDTVVEKCGFIEGNIAGHVLRIERCWSTETFEDTREKVGSSQVAEVYRKVRSDVWRFDITAVIQDMSLIEVAKKQVKALIKRARESVGDALQDTNFGFLRSDSQTGLLSKIVGNSIIQFMISMLTKSYSLAWGVMQESVVVQTVKAVWKSAKDFLTSQLSSVKNWLKLGWKELREALPFDVSGDLRTSQVLAGSMTFTRASGAGKKAKFSKDFSVMYLKQYYAELSIRIPQVVSIKIFAGLNFIKDLSSTFNTVLVLIDGKQHQNIYDECLRCFADGKGQLSFCPNPLDKLRRDTNDQVVEAQESADMMPEPINVSANVSEDESEGESVLRMLIDKAVIQVGKKQSSANNEVRCGGSGVVAMHCAELTIVEPQDCAVLLSQRR